MSEGPMLHVDGAAVPLEPLVEDDGQPLVGPEAAAELALFYRASRTLCVFADGPARPLSAVRRRFVRELRSGDRDGTYERLELIPSAGGWWMRHSAEPFQTTLVPLAGQRPISAVFGGTAAICVLADGSALAIEADHRPLVAIARPGAEVTRTPLPDWLAGEEFCGVHGEWLFSSRAEGRTRELLARRVGAAGLGPRIDLGRLEFAERHIYPCWPHLRGGPDDAFLAVGVSRGGAAPLVATSFLRAGTWTPLETCPSDSLALQVDYAGGVGRVFWRDDREQAWGVLTTRGGGVSFERHQPDEERFLGCSLHLLGEHALGLWTEEDALVGRLGPIAGLEDAPARFRVTGAGEYPTAEVYPRGRHAIVMLTDGDSPRRRALRVGADGQVVPLAVG
ncbi:hypothetical protein [Nannocystis punicea]|uniref:Tocopherol cyclase n=1 Tax=Nannocystis punicea TaxID=2995304 RepID=A0ABY7GYG1_9BACT|nr:hypothetical protein [Nannocystis poenicansa]WAS92022.1 hypothetical protein O0S08_38055 [Nannocystis poenicansa]